MATSDVFIVSIVLPFPECHIVGIIQCVAFSDWHLSHSNMMKGSSMSFHGGLAHLFLVLNNISLSRCTIVHTFIYSLAKGHLGCFQVLTMMNKAAINIVYRFLCLHKFSAPLSKYQGAKFLDSYGKSMFSFVKKCQTVFHSAVPFCIPTSNE